MEGVTNIIEEGVRDDSSTLHMGLEDGPILMEEDVRDDSTTPQMGLEGAAILMEDVRDDSTTPQIGMEFPTPDDAYNFYNQYALKTGFGIRKSSTNTSRADDTTIIYRKFTCNKEGYRREKAKRKGAAKVNASQGATEVNASQGVAEVNASQGATEVNASQGVAEVNASQGPAQVIHNRQLRVGCNARMAIKLSPSNTWIVSTFVKQHNNHELTSPSKTSKHRSHKKVHRKDRVKNIMTKLHSDGIPNYEIAKVCNMLEASQDDRVTPQQVHDHLRIAKKNNIGRNCSEVIKHFQKKQQNDPDFYFSFELSEDLTLRSVFWADGRSRKSYNEFKDVIVFDVTYRTNSFSLPFAPFTGINHHRQSSLFGCALLADETEETFVWLFQNWLTCMNDQAPGAIITDQDAAMGNAIARIFPNSRHRFCEWHMDKNIGEHMVHLKAQHGEEFETYFNKLRNSDSIPEAEACWEALMARYKLPEKSWLPKLWDKRNNWISCYLKDIFFAGTKTSQRSESINAFFDSFVNAKTPLNEFVVQYDKALESRRAAEEDADFNTMNTKPNLTLGWSIEDQAGKCYTKAIFAIFSKELNESRSYWAEKKNKEGTLKMYSVGRQKSDQSQWRTVTFDDSNGVTVSCDCYMFEFTGLLCRHALNILWKKHIPEIPNQYILKRWTINARYQRVSVELGNSAPIVSNVDQDLYRRVQYKCSIALEESSKSSTLCEQFDTVLSKMLAEYRNKATHPFGCDASSQVNASQVGSTAAPTFQNDQHITIRDPIESVKTKGRPRTSSRIQSGLELSQEEKIRKQRNCGFCGGKGHYQTGCAKKKASDAATTSNQQSL